MSQPTLSAERLRELLSYDPETGAFTWNVRRRGIVGGGASAGSVASRRGYSRIQVEGRAYSAHRLAWLYMTGNWPIGDIDHINGRRDDNRLVNLRDVPPSVNRQNLRAVTSRNKSSGFLGVSLHDGKRRSKPWRAIVILDGKKHHIGSFTTPEEAHAAYVAAKRRLHPGNTL